MRPAASLPQRSEARVDFARKLWPLSRRAAFHGQIRMRARHVIHTLGRSGSNTLVDMLNQNPAVLNYGEVLGDWNQIRKLQKRLGLYKDDDAAYLDALLGNPTVLRVANTFRNATKLATGKAGERKRLGQVSTVGFKEFSLNFERRGLQDYLPEVPDLRVIGLVRANVLERMISNAFLQQTGVISSKSKQAGAATRMLHIPPQEMIGRLETIEAENAALETQLSALPADRVLRLDYTDLYSGETRTRETMQQVYDFLDVPGIEPEIRMKKVVKKNPLDAIENREEILAVLRGTRFEALVEES